MTHLPRPHPPIWQKLLAGFLILTAILAMAAVSFVDSPPKRHCLGSDAANRWCVPDEEME